MKELPYILLACIVIVILWSIVKAIRRRTDPKSWYLYQASMSERIEPIEKLYGRYGEIEATGLLLTELKERMQQAKGALYSPVDEYDSGSFVKELHKFSCLMSSAIAGLRSMGKAEEVFPVLTVLVARMLLSEPEKLKETVVIRIPLPFLTQAEEREIDNPVVETLEWALKELEDTSTESKVSWPPIPGVKRRENQRTSEDSAESKKSGSQ